ncbi:hypothetical protein KGM_212847 [Danaus plexippus plexippus]|uniref:Uncharacterized protein n=1 Tax=Danaus plexippus plexippus TaxID=278856 RepID=A0A212EHA6_DANPL|nr:hypothetical protein KGM_212847 [Danaus plexippus plexippus]
MYVLVLLCLSGASCDWVEISQNHYRNEFTRPFTRRDGADESTTAIAVYRNHSVLEKHKTIGVVDRVQNVANIKRVHIPTVKTPSFPNDKIILNSRATHEQKHGHLESKLDVPHHYQSSLSRYHEEEIPSKTDHRHSEHSFETNSGESPFSNVHIKQNSKINKQETVTVPLATNTINKENLLGNVNDEKPISPNYSVIPTRKTIYFDKSITSTKPPIGYQEKVKQNSGEDQKESLTEKPFVTDTTKQSDIRRINISPEKKTPKPQDNIKDSDELDDNEQKHYNRDKEEQRVKTNSEEISHKTKGSTMNTVWKLLKLVTDTISSNTKRGFKSKINYLENLKTRILTSIEDHVERTWPDEDRSPRRARDTGRGHVEFPSSEGALMSISFLTFAVFLIKLVLQVIHTYKNKTMMVTPAVVTAVGRAAAAMKSKNP